MITVVHNQLLCFGDIEMEVVVLALGYQGSVLLSVGRLIVSHDSCLVRKLTDGVGAVDRHSVMCEQGVQESC